MGRWEPSVAHCGLTLLKDTAPKHTHPFDNSLHTTPQAANDSEEGCRGLGAQRPQKMDRKRPDCRHPSGLGSKPGGWSGLEGCSCGHQWAESEEPSSPQVNAFIVRKGAEGLTTAKMHRKLSHRYVASASDSRLRFHY